jgi:hypothetical protein
MKELERLQEKERKKQMKAIEKRTSALQKYQVSLEEQGMFEAYCLLRSHEIQLQLEDQYDFVKFMLKMQELKEGFEGIGILNLIPVGSTVNKIVRRENFMVDVILNYNKTTLGQVTSEA